MKYFGIIDPWIFGVSVLLYKWLDCGYCKQLTMYETTLICHHRPLASGPTDLMFKRHQTKTSLLINIPVGWKRWELKLLKMHSSMMTSSNGNIIRVTDHLWGEFTGHRWIPRTKASDAELCFDVFFDLRLKKRLSKQSWGWWFGTPSRPLWRHCIALITIQRNHTQPSNYILGKSDCERI